MHNSDAYPNGEMTLHSKGLRKHDAADGTPKAEQGRGLTAAQKQVEPQHQKLPLSVCDKDLERLGWKASVEG